MTRATLGAVLALVAAACGGPTITPAPTAPPLPDPTAVAEELIAAPWRVAPIPLSAEITDTFGATCIDAAPPELAGTVAKLPVAVVDARGAGFVTVIVADEFVAYECRLTVAAGAATVDSGPNRLDPSAPAPPADGATLVSRTTIEDAVGTRSLLIGRVGRVGGVVARFEGVQEVEASEGNGWYAAWWPGSELPTTIGVHDSRNIMSGSVELPDLEVEGRVSPASWWLDPGASPPVPDATSVHALVQERICTGATPPEGRLLEPQIFAAEEAFLVTIWIRQVPGGDCQSNPVVPLEIVLPEPVGERGFLDGGQIPPRDASVPPA